MNNDNYGENLQDVGRRLGKQGNIQMTGDETNGQGKDSCAHDFYPTYWGKECRKCLLGELGFPLDKSNIQDPVASNKHPKMPCLAHRPNDCTCSQDPGARGLELDRQINKEINAINDKIVEPLASNTGNLPKLKPRPTLDENHFGCEEEIASLESSLEGMRKRNEELKSQLLGNGSDAYAANRVVELEIKLESVEGKLVAEELLRVSKYANAERLIEWMDNEDRMPASNVFTEGLERQIAYRYERAIHEMREEAILNGAGSSREAALLGKVAQLELDKERLISEYREYILKQRP